MGIHLLVADHVDTAGGVVGDGVLNFYVPVLNTGIHNLEAGHDALGGIQYILFGNTGPLQILLQQKGDFGFRPGLDQITGDGALPIVGHFHG